MCLKTNKTMVKRHGWRKATPTSFSIPWWD